MSLKGFEKNIQSQFGEDGIIEEIFKRIGCENQICVEFGAWDGIHLSNTWHLWHNEGWRALLIEGDPVKHKILVQNTAGFTGVEPYLAFVTAEGENSLESILKKTGMPPDIDLLSIDIDGDDYYIFESLSVYRPRLVIVEYNPTIPPSADIRQAKGGYFGSSALALLNLAHGKGYKLAHVTDTNLFLLPDECFDKLGMTEPALADVFVYRHQLNVISSYDGNTFLIGNPAYSIYHEPGQKIDFPELLANNVQPKKIILQQLPVKGGQAAMIKNILKKVPGVKEVLGTRNAGTEKKLIADWERSGRPSPAPQAYKRKVIREYGAQYRLDVLIETGTFMGDTIASCRKFFKKIYSVELDDTLFLQARKRFEGDQKITILQGDSGELMGTILTNVTAPCLFWLDGHYSEGSTAKGDLNTPILQELKHIFNHPAQGHVILIDDARCFTGRDDYPSLEQLKKIVQQKDPKLFFEVKDDIIRIHG